MIAVLLLSVFRKTRAARRLLLAVAALTLALFVRIQRPHLT